LSLHIINFKKIKKRIMIKTQKMTGGKIIGPHSKSHRYI
jgi:hypothetical protein